MWRCDRASGTEGSPRRMSERGTLSLPMALALSAAAAGFYGSWRTLHEWREKRDHQLLLDGCVAEQAQGMSRRLNRVQRLDQGIRLTRAALLVALEPGTRASLMATLETLGQLVHAEELAWNATAVSWLLRRGCGKLAQALPRPYPREPWRTEPPDPLGTRPLRWKENHELLLQIARPPRTSRAYVVREGRWKAQWRNNSNGSGSH